MKQHRLISAAVAVTFGVATTLSALAQTPTPAQAPKQRQAQESVFGSQLMTVQERSDYRQRMRAIKTPEEREQFRLDHHAKMQARATERGVTMPTEPPTQGKGLGLRDGSQPGMGQGTGPRGTGGGIQRP